MNALINHPSWFRMDRDYTANPNHYMVMSVFGASYHAADAPLANMMKSRQLRSVNCIDATSQNAWQDTELVGISQRVRRSMERPDDLRGDQSRQEVQLIPRAMAAEGRSRNERLPVQAREAAGRFHLARSQAYG